MEEETRQQIVDDEQLRILRIGYFVAAGTTAFVALLGIFYSFLGFFMFSHLPESGGDAPPEFIGRLIGFFGLGFTVVFLSIAVLQFVAGQRLKARRSRIFCIVIAGITCLSIPAGTFLGICTIFVLSRPSVSKIFESASS